MIYVSKTSHHCIDPIDDFQIHSRKLLLDIDPIRKFECRGFRRRINTEEKERESWLSLSYWTFYILLAIMQICSMLK